MALSQDDIDRMEQALARGELTVEFDGRRVTYKSNAEMLTAINYVKSQVALVTEPIPGGTSRMSFATFNRGLHT
jgi:hypothetical protein